MPCKKIVDPATGAVIGFACSRGRRLGPCEICGRAEATILCDGPPPKTGVKRVTCDAAMCRACAKHVGPDRDLCPSCAKEKSDAR